MVGRPHATYAALLLALGACSSSKDGNGIITPPPPPPSTFLVRGVDMSGILENVQVQLDGTLKPGLAVTVNGTALADVGEGLYHGFLPAQLAAGAPINVIVTNGTLTATGTSVVPALPVISNVAATTRSNPVTVSWTTPTSPDSFIVTLSFGLQDGSSGSVVSRVAGSARQTDLSPGSAPAGATFTSVGIAAFMTGTFTGSYKTGSNMHVRTESAPFTVVLP